MNNPQEESIKKEEMMEALPHLIKNETFYGFLHDFVVLLSRSLIAGNQDALLDLMSEVTHNMEEINNQDKTKH